jgi:Mg2+-importing ATPase
LREGAPAKAIAEAQAVKPIDIAPFDYERQMMSTLVYFPDGRRLLVCKGAPEAILKCCRAGGSGLQERLAAQFDSGDRIVAVASRAAAGLHDIHPSDETGLEFAGLLHLADEPKADAASSLARLRKLGVQVKIVTVDNDRTARAICQQLGMEVGGVLTGAQLATMTDDALAHALDATTIFARVTPDQKTRVIEAQRSCRTRRSRTHSASHRCRRYSSRFWSR